MDGALDSCPALVLNADFRPLSYFPLSIWPWQEAVKATLMGRVNTVAEYDRVHPLAQLRDRAAERRLPQGVHPPRRASGVHALQRVPARPIYLPVFGPAAAGP